MASHKPRRSSKASPNTTSAMAAKADSQNHYRAQKVLHFENRNYPEHHTSASDSEQVSQGHSKVHRRYKSSMLKWTSTCPLYQETIRSDYQIDNSQDMPPSTTWPKTSSIPSKEEIEHALIGIGSSQTLKLSFPSTDVTNADGNGINGRCDGMRRGKSENKPNLGVMERWLIEDERERNLWFALYIGTER